MIRVVVKGSFKKIEGFGNRILRRDQFRALEKYGPIGVEALSKATPVDSSLTANSWSYEIVHKPRYFAIHWLNSHIEAGVPIAILIQYGHGTKNGGYVHGEDYINPAIKPIFEQIAADMWKEVTR